MIPAYTTRWASLVAAAAIVFAVTAALLTRLIPGPHTQLDYLIIGTTATLLALVLLFALLGGVVAIRKFRRRR